MKTLLILLFAVTAQAKTGLYSHYQVFEVFPGYSSFGKAQMNGCARGIFENGTYKCFGIYGGLNVGQEFPARTTNFQIGAGPWGAEKFELFACGLVDNKSHCIYQSKEGTKALDVPLKNPSSIVTKGPKACAIDDDGLHCWEHFYGGSKSKIELKTLPTPAITNPRKLIDAKGAICAVADEGMVCWLMGRADKIPMPVSNPREVWFSSAKTDDRDGWNVLGCALDQSEVLCWSAERSLDYSSGGFFSPGEYKSKVTFVFKPKQTFQNPNRMIIRKEAWSNFGADVGSSLHIFIQDEGSWISFNSYSYPNEDQRSSLPFENKGALLQDVPNNPTLQFASRTGEFEDRIAFSFSYIDDEGLQFYTTSKNSNQKPVGLRDLQYRKIDPMVPTFALNQVHEFLALASLTSSPVKARILSALSKWASQSIVLPTFSPELSQTRYLLTKLIEPLIKQSDSKVFQDKFQPAFLISLTQAEKELGFSEVHQVSGKFPKNRIAALVVLQSSLETCLEFVGPDDKQTIQEILRLVGQASADPMDFAKVRGVVESIDLNSKRFEKLRASSKSAFLFDLVIGASDWLNGALAK